MLFSIYGSDLTNFYNTLIDGEALKNITDERFLINEINAFLSSEKRKKMIVAEKYYAGNHDIENASRQMIGKDGALETVDNLPNNKLIDNKFAMLVDQKANYLLGKPFVIETESEQYAKILTNIFDKNFFRMFLNLAQDSLKGGMAWLQPYINEQGAFAIKRFAPYEILPFWADAEHINLNLAVRVYEVAVYKNYVLQTEKHVCIYDRNSTRHYKLIDGSLIPTFNEPLLSYVDKAGRQFTYNWGRLPLIPFKYNSKEIPLISRVKSLQDALNLMLSNFTNNMEEDPRNTILVVKNYDGQDLSQFRANLMKYGAIKIRTVDGVEGGVETLQIEVNSSNYSLIVDLLKQAIISNGRGYDAKDDRMGNNPNQLNIRSMYSDVDLDANMMETEYQASLDQLLWFVDSYLEAIGQGDFFNEPVKIIFNRDIMINETQVIEDIAKSVGILSNETLVAQHPYIDDPKREMDRIKTEKEQAEVDLYGGAFENEE